MYNYGDHEINYQRRFPQWDGFFSFSYHKITLFEKKYDIKLITLISMYHLKLLVSLDRFIKKCWHCSDPLYNYFTHNNFRFVYFEDAVTYFDKIGMFSHKEKQINILKLI